MDISRKRLPREQAKEMELFRSKKHELMIKEIEMSKKQQKNEYTRKLITIVDGKEFDYTPLPIKKVKSYPLFEDNEIMKRSNEIKELLKKKHHSVYGVVSNRKVIRYVDVEKYDKTLDLVNLEEHSYASPLDEAEFVSNHTDALSKAQLNLAASCVQNYNLGYESLDDYYDTRYLYTKGNTSMRDYKFPEITCGVDNCCYRCCEEDVMKTHRELHKASLPFPCLDKNCKHQCKTRIELKMHMRQHCKYIFPCLYKKCHFTSSVPLDKGNHGYTHVYGDYVTTSNLFSRGWCPICRKLVMNTLSHLPRHVEFKHQCRYPGCNESKCDVVSMELHLNEHYWSDIRKGIIKREYNCLIQ